MSTRLVIVRHGRSLAQDENFVAGHRGCKGLTETGIGQVEALRDRLARTGELRDADSLYCSAMRRAIQTAEIIAPALGLPVVQDCGLCEMHEGDEVDGMAIAEVRERYWEPAVAAGKDLSWTSLTPGGESLAEFVARAGAALRRLAEAHAGRTIVVVAHVGTIRSAFSALGGLPDRLPMAVYSENASLTEWRQEEPGSRWSWGLYRLGDASHLGHRT